MRWIEYIQLKHSTPRLIQDERGQSMIIAVMTIIALVAVIGLGVDLGIAYAERVSLSRAMDAAALAGAQELPSEEAAHQRALEYLNANGYDPGSACIETHGSGLGGGDGSCTGSESGTRIIVDTLQFRSGGEANSANRINVRAEQDVQLAFMRVMGFDTVPIGASATAENIEDLDIVIVYDRSGSMQEDTRCYGCWEPDPDAGTDPDKQYPVGETFPLPDSGHCQPSEPLKWPPTGTSYWYLSIEAEHYSRYETDADYHRDRTEYPKTWWAGFSGAPSPR